MSTKFYNTQWQMPNEANKSKQANHSLQAGTTTSGERVDITNLPFSDSQSWTISFWVRPTTISAAALTFGGSQNYSGAGGFIFLLNVGGSITFYSNPNRTYFSFATGNNVVSVDTWHHVIFKYNYGVDYRIYVDGVLQAVSTGQVASDLLYQWPTQNFGLFEKALPGYTGYRLRGSLSDWCFFNYALSDTATTVGDTATGQIAQLYGNGSSLSNPMDLSPAPKVYYKLSDSVWDGSKYITANNAVQDYVFDFTAGLAPNEYINLGNHSVLQPASNYTFSIWFNADSYNYKTLFGDTSNAFTQGILALPRSSSALDYYHNTTSTYKLLTLNLTDFPINKWHNLTITWSASTGILRGFIDGKFNAQLTGVNDIKWDNELLIGRYSQTYPFLFEGKLSNFAMWNTTLTDGFSGTPTSGDVAGGQVAEVYNNGSPQTTITGTPVGWWKLDASEIYNNTTTEWEISDATAAIKLSTLQNPPGTFTENAYRVSDSSGVINFPSNYTDTLKISTSVWFYAPSSVSSGQVVQLLHAGPQSRLWLGFSGTNQLRAIITGGGWMYGNNVTMGQWNQFTATINIVSNTRTVKFYINGQPAGTGTQSGGSPTSALDGITVSTYGSGTYSGQVLSSNSVFWDNVILTDAEVLSHYNSFSVSNGLPTLQPALSSFPQSSSISGWYKLDGNPKDSSGNSRDATYGSHSNVNIGPSVSNSNGQSSGMSQANLVQSDLQTVAPYSKYAMNFDGTNEKMAFNSSPIDLGLSSTETWWIKYSNSSATSSSIASAPVFAGFHILYEKSTNKVYYRIDSTNLYYEWEIPSTYFTDNLWHHYAIVRNDSLPFSSYIKLYIDGNLFGSPTAVNATSKSTTNTKITDWGGASAYPGIVASFSNIAFWNTALTASEAREIYNEGLPTNLNNFSGTAPVAWWQMGSNSSFDGNYWTCADEIGSNNGSTSNIGEESLVNGVGTTSNGASSGFSAPSATVTNIINNAPYSDKNAVSINMQSAKSNSGISNSTPQAT